MKYDLATVTAHSKVTNEDMESFNHRDDWNVPCLYCFEAQKLVDDKVMVVLTALEQEK